MAPDSNDPPHDARKEGGDRLTSPELYYFAAQRYNRHMHLGKLLTSIIIATFLLVGAIGVAYSGTMMGHGMGDMVGCPLMGHDAAVCGMNPLEHLSIWQSMFAAIPVQSAVMLLMLLLALFFMSRLNRYRWLLHPSLQPVYISYDPEIATHDPLRRFIASGLMHPKIF